MHGLSCTLETHSLGPIVVLILNSTFIIFFLDKTRYFSRQINFQNENSTNQEAVFLKEAEQRAGEDALAVLRVIYFMENAHAYTPLISYISMVLVSLSTRVGLLWTNN